MENSNSNSININNNEPKLQFFQKSKEYFMILGISLNPLMDEPHLNIPMVSFAFIICALGLVFNFVFVIYEASTIWEFTQSIYWCSVSVICCGIYAILVFRVKILFELIKTFENVIDVSELNLSAIFKN